jgi:hypothetical protein
VNFSNLHIYNPDPDSINHKSIKFFKYIQIIIAFNNSSMAAASDHVSQGSRHGEVARLVGSLYGASSHSPGEETRVDNSDEEKLEGSRVEANAALNGPSFQFPHPNQFAAFYPRLCTHCT